MVGCFRTRQDRVKIEMVLEGVGTVGFVYRDVLLFAASQNMLEPCSTV